MRKHKSVEECLYVCTAMMFGDEHDHDEVDISALLVKFLENYWITMKTDVLSS